MPLVFLHVERGFVEGGNSLRATGVNGATVSNSSVAFPFWFLRSTTVARTVLQFLRKPGRWLVAELPPPCQYHRDPMFVRCLNHLGVSNGPTRLNDCKNACFSRLIDPVAERKERVRAQD